MAVTRRTVLEHLAEASDPDRRETTTLEALASELDADEHAVEVHLDGLISCELAHRAKNGAIRVTITGEELLELDADEMVIVDPDSWSEE